MNWKEDLLFLLKELPKRHVDFFNTRNENDMSEEMMVIIKNLPKLSDNEILAKIVAWLASAKDSHTKILNFEESVFPVAFYWFEEGLYATAASKEYEYLVYGKLEGINGKCMDKVVEKLRPLISYENEYLFRERLPHFLISPKILHGMNITPEFGRITYNIRAFSGEKIDAEVIACSDCVDKFFETGPIGDGGSKYTNRKRSAYWFEYLKSYKVLYFQYNICKEDFSFPHQELIDELVNILNEEDVKKLVIDLRYNQGGNSFLLMPFLDMLSELKDRKCFEELYAITGRATFSSGFLHVIRLKIEGAILIGQPTGSKPNFFGEVGFFQLPNSGLRVNYSTRHFRIFKQDKMTLTPDIKIPILFSDYLENRDMLMEHILKK